jgi:aspartyl protease family protein
MYKSIQMLFIKKYLFSALLFVGIPFISVALQSCAGCSNPNMDNFENGSRSESQPIAAYEDEIFEEELSSVEQESNTIPMLKDGGVYRIPVYVNDVKMQFIFDTGAGMISISSTEAGFLYKQGTLTEDDFLGTANFMDANGDITPGVIVKLKTVQIGNRLLENVEASVVNNNKAPLLLGQSALSKFGKISIDYGKETLSFED